jgi:hypothetical protein
VRRDGGGDGVGADNDPVGSTMIHQSDDGYFVMAVHWDSKGQGDWMIWVPYNVQQPTMMTAV